MRRSRSAFAFVFVVLSALLYLTHLARPSTLEDAYESAKSNWPGTTQPDDIQVKDDSSVESQSQLEHLPDSYSQAGSHSQNEAPLIPEHPLDLSSPLPPLSQSPATSPIEPELAIADAFEDVKYPFQEDLDLPLPTTNLATFKDRWPHNYNPSITHPFAYAAFMNTRNPSIRDPYFMALQNLIWRVLWSPRAKTNLHPFIAFVAQHVTQEQRDLLAGAGAIVRELPPLPWNPPQSTDGQPIYGRWRDMFSKLHMWDQTDFERILFLDADAFPVTNIDAMFEVAPVQKCNPSNLEFTDFFPDGSSSCGTLENLEEYIFAAVPQGPGLPVEINVGAMVFTPSTTMYRRFLQNYQYYENYVTHMADQGFMSWQFKTDGAFPPTLLGREWDGYFPQQDEQGKLNVVHEKLWADGTTGWLEEEWTSGWGEMVAWYEGGAFRRERENDDELMGLLRLSLANKGGIA